MSGSDPRDPNTILQTCQRFVSHYVHDSLPNLLTSIWELPSKTVQRYVERDRSFDARQGPIGDPFRGFIDPGLADGIDERRKRYEEYLQRKKEAREKTEKSGHA